MVSSDRSIEGDIDENLEGLVSGTEDCRIQGTEGEGMGSHWEKHWEMEWAMREVPLMCSQ